jgi:hypothetical protein
MLTLALNISFTESYVRLTFYTHIFTHYFLQDFLLQIVARRKLCCAVIAILITTEELRDFRKAICLAFVA